MTGEQRSQPSPILAAKEGAMAGYADTSVEVPERVEVPSPQSCPICDGPVRVQSMKTASSYAASRW